MSNKPFDLDKINYDKQRRLMRRKLIRRSSPAIVVVFLLILWFGLPTPLTFLAIEQYEKTAYGPARSWLSPLTYTSPEPFVIAFNSGTIDTKLGKYDQAETELSRAVSIAPEDKLCMAAQNLAVALQSHAKSIEKSNSKKSSEQSAKMQKVIKKYPECFKGATSGGGGGGGSSGTNQESDAPSESQQDQLQQKEQAGRDRKAKYASDDAFDADNPSIKRW